MHVQSVLISTGINSYLKLNLLKEAGGTKSILFFCFNLPRVSRAVSLPGPRRATGVRAAASTGARGRAQRRRRRWQSGSADGARCPQSTRTTCKMWRAATRSLAEFRKSLEIWLVFSSSVLNCLSSKLSLSLSLSFLFLCGAH